jgi:hypothetical protein
MRRIEFSFRGNDYAIPAHRAFKVGADVEEILTLADLSNFARRPLMFKLASAFATMLRAAGSKVRDEDVFEDMTGGEDPVSAQEKAAAAMNALIAILTGGMPADGEGGEPPGKATAS